MRGAVAPDERRGEKERPLHRTYPHDRRRHLTPEVSCGGPTDWAPTLQAFRARIIAGGVERRDIAAATSTCDEA